MLAFMSDERDGARRRLACQPKLEERRLAGSTGLVTVAVFMRNAIAAHAKQLAAGWL